MKTNFLLALALLFWAKPSFSQVSATTIFLVRHCEKALESTNNPNLSEQGAKRAAHLAEILKNAGIEAIYSTDTKRTMQTGEPLAALPEALALAFVKDKLGEKVLADLLEKKQSLYEKERNNEPNQEAALLYADGADYLEINRGAIVLFEAMQEMGLPVFMAKVKALNVPGKEQYQTFASFYRQLKPKLSSKMRKDIEELN
jgi:hypothetical protein